MESKCSYVKKRLHVLRINLYFALFAIQSKDLKEKERKGSLVYKARVDKSLGSHFYHLMRVAMMCFVAV